MVFWKDTIDVCILSLTVQHAIAKVTQGNNAFIITNVYPSCDSAIRKDLWWDLSIHLQADAWVIAGDFNVVCSPEEKAGVNMISFQDVEDFNQMIFSNGLTYAGFTGNKYTWSNNR